MVDFRAITCGGAVVALTVASLSVANSPATFANENLTLAMAENYRPLTPANGEDDYRCFLLEPNLSTDRMATALKIKPLNTKIAHHGVLYAVPAEAVPAARALDAQTPGQGWQCFGGPGVRVDQGIGVNQGRTPWIGSWAPGGDEVRFPSGTGVKLGAGSAMVLQMHYNLRHDSSSKSNSHRSVDFDRTSVNFELTPSGSKLTPLETMLLAAPVELACAKDEKGALCERNASITDLVERTGPTGALAAFGLAMLCGKNIVSPQPSQSTDCTYRVGSDMIIHGVAGHMHRLGKSISIDQSTSTGQTRLLDTSVWNFDDQSATWLDRPAKASVGQSLKVSCTHDTKLRKLMPETRNLPPRYVTWGEGSGDEMCLGLVLYTRQ